MKKYPGATILIDVLAIAASGITNGD